MLNNFRIMFLRDSKKQPIGCIAIKLDDKSHKAQYQISVLNPEDRFNRSVARQLAIGRMVESPLSVLIPKNPTMHEITEEVMLAINSNSKLPARARRSAKAWVKRFT